MYSKERSIFQALADYHGIPFLETSAKTGENVEEAFSLISQAIYDKVNTLTDGIKRLVNSILGVFCEYS